MKYQPPPDSLDPNAPYVGRNQGAGIQGSRVPPKAVEHPQREIIHVLEQAGLIPEGEDLTQLWQALQETIRERSVPMFDLHSPVTTMPGGTNTVILSYQNSSNANLVDSVVNPAAGTVTIGPGDAGVWLVYGTVLYGITEAASIISARLLVNNQIRAINQMANTNGNAVVPVVRALDLEAGDVMFLSSTHGFGAARSLTTNPTVSFMNNLAGIRLGI